MDEAKRGRGSAYEHILALCSGLKKVCPQTDVERAYNDALGDIFDYIIDNQSSYLMPGTVRAGKWVRDRG